MKGALRLFTLAGIPVQVHWTFALLLLWVLYTGFSSGLDTAGLAFLFSLVLVMFCCVVLHEYGHALTARRYGIHTRDITLSPIGGVARLESVPSRPLHELLIALAGPLVNVGIVLLLLLATLLSSQPAATLLQYDETSESYWSNFMPLLFQINLMLVFFNLLPAFPMDGGRVLRALLAIRLGRMQATRIAVVIGQIMAVGFFAYGIWQAEFTLALIGVFVFFTATYEFRMVKMEDVLFGTRIGEIQRMYFTTCNPDDTMEEVVSHFRRGWESHFLVLDTNGIPTAALGEEQLLEALDDNDLQAPVSHYARPLHALLQTDDSLRTAIQQFRRDDVSILPVFDGNGLTGVLDLDMVENYLRLRQRMFHSPAFQNKQAGLLQ